MRAWHGILSDEVEYGERLDLFRTDHVKQHGEIARGL